MRKEKDERYQVPSVVRAFKIMETLSENPQGMTISELSQELDLPVSSTSTLLNTLHSLGYLVRESSAFRLSARLLEIGNRTLQNLEITWVIEKHLRELVDEVGITAHAAMLEGDEAVIIEKLDPPSSSFIKINTYVGRKSKLTCTSLGKLLVAYQNESNRERIVEGLDYPEFTRNTITTSQEYSKALEEVREKGYAIDDEEEELGIRCVGAPVFAADGRIVAAVSLCGTTSQLRVSNLSNLIDKISATADKISAEIGWTKAPQEVIGEQQAKS